LEQHLTKALLLVSMEDLDVGMQVVEATRLRAEPLEVLLDEREQVVNYECELR
jgi:hypothetical protein